MRSNSIETLRAQALGLALGTVGLTALAALVFPGETSLLAPLALVLPFLTMGVLEGLVADAQHSPSPPVETQNSSARRPPERLFGRWTGGATGAAGATGTAA